MTIPNVPNLKDQTDRRTVWQRWKTRWFQHPPKTTPYIKKIKHAPKLVRASKHDRQSIKVHLPWHKRRSWCTWCFWRWVCRCCFPGSWGGCWWKRLAAHPQWGSSAARPAPSWRQNLKTNRNHVIMKSFSWTEPFWKHVPKVRVLVQNQQTRELISTWNT